jgi:hypothetical protein
VKRLSIRKKQKTERKIQARRKREAERKRKEKMTGSERMQENPRISSPWERKKSLKLEGNSGRKLPMLGISPKGKICKKTSAPTGKLKFGEVGKTRLLFEGLLQPTQKVRPIKIKINPLHFQLREKEIVAANGKRDERPVQETSPGLVDRIGQAKKSEIGRPGLVGTRLASWNNNRL